MIQSLTHVMEVLEHLRKADKSCSFTEPSQMSGPPSSTVHRILQAFCSADYVSHDPRTHLYRLGTALIPLGMTATRWLWPSDSAKPVLKDSMKITKEDVSLVIMSGYRSMVLEKIEGLNPPKVIERFGNEADLYCGGSRHALLAFQSDNFIRGYVQEYLRDEPGFTPEEEEKPSSSLLRIHEEGVAISRGEYILDAAEIDAPIFDMSGKMAASINLIALQSRTSRVQREEFEVLAKQHAAQLPTLLGFTQK